MRKPITKEEVETLSKGKKVHLIDIRSGQEYEKQHVPDADNVPVDKLAGASESFSKTDMYVCICNHGGQRSQGAAEYLHGQGFEHAFYLEGGTAGWFDGGH